MTIGSSAVTPSGGRSGAYAVTVTTERPSAMPVISPVRVSTLTTVGLADRQRHRTPTNAAGFAEVGTNVREAPITRTVSASSENEKGSAGEVIASRPQVDVSTAVPSSNVACARLRTRFSRSARCAIHSPLRLEITLCSGYRHLSHATCTYYVGADASERHQRLSTLPRSPRGGMLQNRQGEENIRRRTEVRIPQTALCASALRASDGLSLQ